MKKLQLLLAYTVIYLSSCSSGKYTASREYDDVYYTSADKQQPEITQPASSTSPDNYTREENNSNQDRFNYDDQQPTTSTQEKDGNTYITNNYYNDDDYYDYAYSSRIKRFYHPYGWSYYDPFYTNSYWYDYNPYSWGVSIYLGYNWWNPYPSFGFGYGYPSYGYNAWNNPWNSPYAYGAGYNNGYIDGYYAGLYNGTFNPYYFNSYDSYSYYYGPRGKSSALNTTGGTRNISQLYATNVIERERKEVRVDPFETVKHITPSEEIRTGRAGNATDTKAEPANDIRNTRSENGNTKDVKGTRGEVKGVTPKNEKPNSENIKERNTETKNGTIRNENGNIRNENGNVRPPENNNSDIRNNTYPDMNDRPVKPHNNEQIPNGRNNGRINHHQVPPQKEETAPEIKLPKQERNHSNEQQNWNPPQQQPRSNQNNNNNSGRPHR
jgi:hypothetical protein